MRFPSFSLRRFTAGLALAVPIVVCAPALQSFGPVAALAAAQDQTPPFFADLSPYGAWIDDAALGPVWQPADVDTSFRPYQDGRWRNTPNLGWYFEASQPWGDIVFHYGRWTFDDTYGWVWVPGTEWGPAWVSWRHGQHSFGWAPIGPQGQDAVDASYWSFADDTVLANDSYTDLYAVVYARPRVHDIFVKSAFLGHPQSGRPVDAFLSPALIERESNVRIPTGPVDVRVALDARGQPIGWNGGLFGAGVRIQYEPVRARPDARPSPAVTELLLYNIRSGRVRPTDRYAGAQVADYAAHGDFRFADPKQQALVPQPSRPGAGGPGVGAILNAVRSASISVGDKPLPPATPHPVTRFKNPDEASAHPEAFGVPPAVRVFPPEAARPAAKPGVAEPPRSVVQETPRVEPARPPVEEPQKPAAHEAPHEPANTGEPPKSEVREPPRANEPPKAVEPVRPEVHETPKVAEPPKSEVREPPRAAEPARPQVEPPKQPEHGQAHEPAKEPALDRACDPKTDPKHCQR